jgi:integrase
MTRKAKIQALAQRPGTPGEAAAAAAALERIAEQAEQAPAARARLTDALVRKLPLPAGGHTITWDIDVAGFGIRITAGGARSFIFNYRVRGSGQQRRVTIGAAGNWSTGSARSEARRLRRLIDSGADPRGDQEEARDAPTVAELIDRFELEHLPRKRPATIKDYRGMLEKHVRPFFGKHTKVADVAYSDIDALHRKITASGAVYVANRCVAMLSKMFSLAVKWEMRATNPCRGIERNAEQKRKRYLSGDELRRLTKALSETPDRQFATIIMLLILTGARRGEVLGMRWADLTLVKGKAVWIKPGSTTKQKSDHVVPLAQPARQLLIGIKRRDHGEFVFPSSGSSGHIVEVKKGWAALLARAGIEGLRLHDVRHSFAAQLASSGASLALIGAMLGHSSPTTTARYAHLFDDTQREAAERVGKIVGKANGDRYD